MVLDSGLRLTPEPAGRRYEVQAEHVVFQTCTQGEEFTITLDLVFEEITGTESKLLFIPVFSTNETLISFSSSLPASPKELNQLPTTPLER